MAAYILWLFAIVLGSVCAVLLLNGHRSPSLWTGCFCLIAVLLGISICIQTADWFNNLPNGQIDPSGENESHGKQSADEAHNQLEPSTQAAGMRSGTEINGGQETTEANGKDNQKQNNSNHIPTVLLVANIIMAIATCALAFYSQKQFRLSDEHLSDSYSPMCSFVKSA
jgi:hypothetical protein